MQALHTSTKNTTKNVDESNCLSHEVEQKSQRLMAYLAGLKRNKGGLSAEEHGQVIVKLTHEIGQAALGELFGDYDVNNDVISVDQQTYRRKHKAPKEYQTAFGTVRIERHVYVNRKADGDGKSICPLEMQAGSIGVIGRRWQQNIPLGH